MNKEQVLVKSPIKLSDFKNKKKYKKIIDDLSAIIKIYNLTLAALKYFSKYTIVMETISVLQSNKVLLEIHLTKYRDMVESVNDEKKN
jgi:hypothetical protein